MMASDDPDTQSLAQSRDKRVRKTTERGAELGAEFDRLRKAREVKQLKEKIRAEQQSQLVDPERPVKLIFGLAEAMLTGDPELDQANKIAHKAGSLIRALAHRTGIDYTLEYERGEKTVEELEQMLRESSANEPSGKGKGKAIANMLEYPEEYPGVSFGQSPQTLNSKHSTTVRYLPTSQDHSPSDSTPTTSKRPSDGDTQNMTLKKHRTATMPPNQPNTRNETLVQARGDALAPSPSASQSAGAKYPRLERTDKSTIVFGKRLKNPQCAEERVKTGIATTSVRHAHALSSNSYLDDDVPAPARRPSGSQPLANQGLKVVAVSKAFVSAPGAPLFVATPSRHFQPQFSSHSAPPKASPAIASRPTAHSTVPISSKPSAQVARPTEGKQTAGNRSAAAPQAQARSTPGLPRDQKRTASSLAQGGSSSKSNAPPPVQHAPKVPTHSRAGRVASNTPNASTRTSGHNPANSKDLRQSGNPGTSKARPSTGANAPRQRTTRPNLAPRQRAAHPNNGPRGAPAPEAPPVPNEDDTDVDADAGMENEGPSHQTRVLNPNKPALWMFDSETQELLKLMVERARPRVIADGTFNYSPLDAGEKVDSRDKIVADAFAWACKQRGLKKPYLIIYGKYFDSLITSYRGQAKNDIKTVLDDEFGFSERTPGENATKEGNLLPHAFHHGDPDKVLHPFENPFLPRACRKLVFEGALAYAVKHPKLFNPLPPRFIAFVLAIANHVIYAYRNGKFNKDDKLCVKQQTQSFRRYLKKLVEMHEERPKAYYLLFATMYDQCRFEVEKDAGGPPPRSSSPVREWSPDIEEDYVSKYPVPPSDAESEEELVPAPSDQEELAEPDDDDDLYADDPQFGEEDEDYGEAEAGPSGIQDTYDDELEPVEEEMAEFVDEDEPEFDEDEVADT